MKQSIRNPKPMLGAWRLLLLLLTLPGPVKASTITDNFTDPSNWGTPTAMGGTISVGSGRMNYTAATTANSGAAIPRNAPLLPTTQDWSLKVEAHLNAFTLTTAGQFGDVFLGLGKTGDWINTHVTFEFGRGYWGNPAHKGYYISDDVRINGTDAPALFNNWNVTSSDVALRMDYRATNHTITYYFDADGATGGYNWVPQGTANLATGTYNLNLSPTDTLTVFLLGSSELQTVADGQAYLSNLVITLNQSPVVTTGTGVATSATSATVSGTVNPNGLPTTAQFEYGLTTNYGGTVSVTLSPNNGVTGQAVNATLNGLQSGATYHYRLTALNSGGAGIGSDATFTVQGSSFNTTTTNGTISITGYTGPGGAVSIPNIIDGLPVTRVEDYAFYGCTNITSVTIPNGVTGIGNVAFAYCTNLTSIAIPDSVTSIGSGAFEFCKLGSITIPNGVTSIDSWTFAHCSNLTYVSIGGSVTSIGDRAFAYCTSLTNVTVFGPVAEIGDYSFGYCSSLTGVFWYGNAPAFSWYPVYGSMQLTFYYLEGTAGWYPYFGGGLYGCPTALWTSQPVIATLAANHTVSVGGNVTLNGLALGTPPFGYQWLFNGINLEDGGRISGASTPTLLLTGVQTNDAANYSVIVTNAYGSVTSSVAVLTVLPLNSALYITNATLTVEGYADFEVVAPSNGVYSLLLSTNLRDWESVDILTGPTNRFFVNSYPTTVAEMGNVFVRVVVGLVPLYQFYLNFDCTAGTLVAGTPSVFFPQTLQRYYGFLEVNGIANPADGTNVFFTGPTGSGLTNALPAGSDLDPENYGANYWSAIVTSPAVPPPGTWTVNYGGTNLLYVQPDAQAHFVVPHPTVVVSNGLLVSVNWVYRNPTTGQVLSIPPAFLRVVTVEVFGGAPSQRMYDSNNLSRQTTNHVFASPLPWSEVESLSISYGDDVGGNGNEYSVFYTK